MPYLDFRDHSVVPVMLPVPATILSLAMFSLCSLVGSETFTVGYLAGVLDHVYYAWQIFN